MLGKKFIGFFIEPRKEPKAKKALVFVPVRRLLVFLQA